MPSQIVTPEEHELIVDRIPGMVHVQDLIKCGSTDVEWLLRTVTKPLRPYWITNPLPCGNAIPEYDTDSYLCIVCISCSNIDADESLRMTEPWYTPSTADDEESWSRGLTPSLLWSNRDAMLPHVVNVGNGSDDGGDDTDRIINALVQKARKDDEEWYQHSGGSGGGGGDSNNDQDDTNNGASYYSIIGKSGMAIGTRTVDRVVPRTAGTTSMLY
jgi:hypothetical protein